MLDGIVLFGKIEGGGAVDVSMGVCFHWVWWLGRIEGFSSGSWSGNQLWL